MTLDLIESRWLPKDDFLSWTINGVVIDPATRTRREEYTWAAGQVIGSLVLDCATGYIDTWHNFPEIITRKEAGRFVIGLDMNTKTLAMPKTPAVLRMLGNITTLPFANEAFDTVCCISTLEHMQPAEVRAVASEMLRVCRRRLVLTADYGNWIPELFGFDIGDPLPEEGMLAPPVYALSLDIVR